MSVKHYPLVMNEWNTLNRVVAGASLARYGDGEFKMIRGGSIKSQVYDKGLSARLAGILRDSGQCLVGIPNIYSDTPKREFWDKYLWTAKLLEARPYASSFITRPDSAPWIDTAEYWRTVESLWRGREVTLVRGSTKSLVGERLVGAGEVREIVAPRQHAWSEYKTLLKRIGKPERALLCLGPTATVLAVDLCALGVHAIDLGHVGMFLKKHHAGVPMVVTEEDKRR